MRKKTKKSMSISYKWLFNSLSATILILAVMGIAVLYTIQNYYYSTARQVITAEVRTGSNLLEHLVGTGTYNINEEIRSMVKSFDRKNEIELMAIDFGGNVKITSSGFDAGPIKLPDYEAAVSSETGTGYYVGKLDSGEKVMAVTQILPVDDNEFYALRYMTSLKQIDNTIFVIAMAYVALSVIILLFVAVIGVYFSRSIVRPIREIGNAARKIATGDLDIRIEPRSSDEVGELCNIINHMADELGTSEKLKNDFISSVSHELRTPLTAIKGWSETLMGAERTDLGLIKKGMWVITSEAERLSDMVEELLDFSRIQNGAFSMMKTKIDILAELDEAVLIYTQRAERDGKVLKYNEPEALPFVFGDKNRLRQVFINIIDNALKYSDPGDSVIVNASESDGRIVITVADTGVGISKDDLPNVKQKFYKADQTRRGSGIGLAVALEIIELHNGELDIDSEEGVGTVVTITLPAMKENEEPLSEIVKPSEEVKEMLSHTIEIILPDNIGEEVRRRQSEESEH